jgi:hypothetical protein
MQLLVSKLEFIAKYFAIQELTVSQGLVAHACNPCYFGG